jgi:V-type H+-transporting ATPase subunit E
MSAIHALSDDQVAGELKKMTAFIRQEAYEKAKEIEIKADEEFAIEKSKLVRQETSAIDSAFEKRFKQASMSQQIARSTLANRSRLRVLGARQELLDALFDASREKVATVAEDKRRYQRLLAVLILEGMYHMDEPHMQVRARKADYEVARAAIDDATKEYKSNAGKQAKVTLDESQPLPAGSYVLLPSMVLANSVGLVALSSQEPEVESRSTTRWTSDFGYWRRKRFHRSGTRCSERTRTGGSKIDVAMNLIAGELPVRWWNTRPFTIQELNLDRSPRSSGASLANRWSFLLLHVSNDCNVTNPNQFYVPAINKAS